MTGMLWLASTQDTNYVDSAKRFKSSLEGPSARGPHNPA